MNVKNYPFPDFLYTASEISKYHLAADIFTMLLKNGNIIHYQPDDINVFEAWLQSHNITNGHYMAFVL